ncbi:Fic family protein [Jatrophihabitans sp.]|uniref:Fic family protein n=1 Tax=Jatrophihabitans sp. TaxID=1932789 RepID=UPI002B9427E2|nr:Fic family protein [Jatrophihabitans sp.]
MLFQAPVLDAEELAVLRQLDELKKSLRYSLHEPKRWNGSLRRLSFARNIQGSNSIEGFDAALDDAAAVAVGEEPLDVTIQTRLALEGYRTAMTYVLQLSEEADDFRYSTQLLKSLHFMMTGYALANRPGRWRAGPVYVHRAETDEIVHEGVDIDFVPGLMEELVGYLDAGDDVTIVKAAMAHLNLVMIHPFRDGNGRMARCLQSLVLAREGVLSPVFMSIEEYLGRNTPAYYQVLGEVGGGSWRPERDARPWIRFVLTAHLRQARTLRQRVRDSERLWSALVKLVGDEDDRALLALYDAAFGFRIRRGTYRKIVAEGGEEISEQTAGRDLKSLADRGFLLPHGERRGRYYVAAPSVRNLLRDVKKDRDPRDDRDPFSS